MIVAQNHIESNYDTGILALGLEVKIHGNTINDNQPIGIQVEALNPSISFNNLSNTQANYLQQKTGILVKGENQNVSIYGNRIEDHIDYGIGIDDGLSINVRYNIINNHGSLYSVAGIFAGDGDDLLIQYNCFTSNNPAILAPIVIGSGQIPVDARYNWWGPGTGLGSNTSRILTLPDLTQPEPFCEPGNLIVTNAGNYIGCTLHDAITQLNEPGEQSAEYCGMANPVGITDINLICRRRTPIINGQIVRTLTRCMATGK
ncbi:MAG: hypothetical protein ACI8P9_000086 [Parasphingorhabdus sp.]